MRAIERAGVSIREAPVEKIHAPLFPRTHPAAATEPVTLILAPLGQAEWLSQTRSCRILPAVALQW